MLTQLSPTAHLIEMIQGKSHNYAVSIGDIDEVGYNFDGYSGSMVLRERPEGPIIGTYTSGSGDIILRDPDATASTASIDLDATIPPSDQVGSIDIDGWVLNLHYTSGSGTPGSAPLLSWGSLAGWKAIIRAISDIINVGSTSEPGFALSGIPGAHPSVQCVAVTPDVGTAISLDLTSRDGGSNGDLIAYDFTDSQGNFSDSGFLAGGIEAGANVTIELDSAQTTAILANSHRPTGQVHLIGDLEVINPSSESEHVIRLDFNFRQTT